MRSKVLKITGIIAVIGLLLFGVIELLVIKNKKKIFRAVQEVVNENLNGNLEIEDIQFRPFEGGLGFNFTMTYVKLTDSLYKVHATPFLNVEAIHITLDLSGIYKGDYRIKELVLKNGAIRAFVQKDGYTNASIFRSSKKPKKSKPGEGADVLTKLGTMRFVNLAVSYNDSVTGKGYSVVLRDASNRVTQTDSTTNANFEGNVFYEGLRFNPEKGSFLANQETKMSALVGYNQEKKILTVYPSKLTSGLNDDINISGVFTLKDTLHPFTVNFQSKGIRVENALPLLPKVIRDQIDAMGVKALVETDVMLVGRKKGTKPYVKLHFKTKPFTYKVKIGALQNVVAEGYYTNRGDTLIEPGPTNAKLHAPGVVGYFGKIPFKVDFVINNFVDPIARLEGMIKADSSNLNHLVDSTKYRFRTGTAAIDFHFNGSLKKFYDASKDNFNGKLWGKLSLRNIGIDNIPRGIKLRKVKGDFNFNESAFVFSNLSLSDGLNALYLKGKVIDLIPYLFGSPKPLRASVNINIPTWRLNWLEPLLAVRDTKTRRKGKQMKLSELLDDAIDQMEITARLNSNQMSYKRLVATNVSTEFMIKNNSIKLSHFNMKAFKGAGVSVSGEMNNAGGRALPYVTVKGNVTNADVESVFHSFDNFGQTTLTDKNLKGRLTTDFTFESNVNNNVQLVPTTMKGRLGIDFRNGYINNFAPFMKMKKLIFKNRNFESVRFAPISTNFILKGEEIEIEPMEIESNVMTLFVDGVYSFGKKTDINIGIPLSNLKKRDSTYVLDPNNPERKEGSKIYLKAIEENGEVNFKMAFRKKERKPKKEQK